MGAADSTALSGSSGVVINIENKKDTTSLADALERLNVNCNVNWSFGPLANQANCLAHDVDSTDDSGKEILLKTGSLKNAFGDSITMDAIKMLYVKNTHASLVLEVFGGANDVPILAATGDILELPPGGFILWVCPTAAGIVLGANEKLKFAAKTSGTITFEYAVMGLD